MVKKRLRSGQQLLNFGGQCIVGGIAAIDNLALARGDRIDTEREAVDVLQTTLKRRHAERKRYQDQSQSGHPAIAGRLQSLRQKRTTRPKPRLRGSQQIRASSERRTEFRWPASPATRGKAPRSAARWPSDAVDRARVNAKAAQSATISAPLIATQAVASIKGVARSQVLTS